MKGKRMTRPTSLFVSSRLSTWKDTSSGQGLVWVDGQQYGFDMGPVWKSGVPPAVGMTVEVECSADGSVTGVTQVPDSQIAKEQAEAVMNAALEKGGAVFSYAVACFGLPLLIATGLLIVSWFFLNAVSVDVLLGKVSFTFWQAIGFINAGNAWQVVMQGWGPVRAQDSMGFSACGSASKP
jgi:hypothetical protein